MSFLKNYAEQNKLPALRGAAKKRLENIEKQLDAKTQGDNKFSDIIQGYSDQIVSLVERMKTEFADWNFSVGKVSSVFRFVIDIASEVSSIVKEIEGKIVPPSLSPEEAKAAKVLFGQELTYFIYMLWDPRLVKWVPIGIESYVEKKVIYWLAGMVVERSLGQFDAQAVVVKKKVGRPKKKK